MTKAKSVHVLTLPALLDQAVGARTPMPPPLDRVVRRSPATPTPLLSVSTAANSSSSVSTRS